jgi:hypothetical protein
MINIPLSALSLADWTTHTSLHPNEKAITLTRIQKTAVVGVILRLYKNSKSRLANRILLRFLEK